MSSPADFRGTTIKEVPRWSHCTYLILWMASILHFRSIIAGDISLNMVSGLLLNNMPCMFPKLQSRRHFKITLPYGQVPNLLRLLWANNISKGHLMPTYDNVTRSLESKWNLWDY